MDDKGLKGPQTEKPAALEERTAGGTPAPQDPPLKSLGAKLGERTAGGDACPTDRIVDAWVVEYFYSSPIARNTDCWNLLMMAKEVLKERLRA